MRKPVSRKWWAANESGVAAIEFALILPLLLTLSLGMLDVTTALSLQRKLTYAGNVVADLVTQQAPSVTPAKIDDFFRAAEIAMRSGATSPDLSIRVFGYGLNAQGGLKLKWSRSNGGRESCNAPATGSFTQLMTAPNDLVVAVVCTRYNLVAGQIVGPLMGGTSFLLQEQVVLRPREFAAIDCNGC